MQNNNTYITAITKVLLLLIIATAWLTGIIHASGIIQTLLAILCMPYAWYLVANHFATQGIIHE